MELQQIGVGHRDVSKIRDIQGNKIPNPKRLFPAEGLFENNIVLKKGLAVDTVFWCPEVSTGCETAKRAEQLVARADRAYRVSKRVFERIAERPNADGLVTLARLPHWSPEDLRLPGNALVVVADGIEIPGNLGTLLRSMDACSADALILVNRKTRMTHPKVLRSSQGMSAVVPSVEFESVSDAASWLSAHSFRVLVADSSGASYRLPFYSGRTALVVGSERYGPSPQWRQSGFETVGVPMLGMADSLNVSVSASVILYEARAQKSTR
jgi:tRNA G18 (ribose-2'-O)-methylase SpoU